RDLFFEHQNSQSRASCFRAGAFAQGRRFGSVRSHCLGQEKTEYYAVRPGIRFHPKNSTRAGLKLYNHPMVSFWPFKSSGKGRIQDLQAPRVAEAALKSFQKAGRSSLSLRLLYRTLELDPFNAQGLLILSELYRGRQKGVRPSGDEIFAGIIL